MMKKTFFPVAFIMMFLFIFVPAQPVHAGTSCYTVTPEITNAVEDYLTEIYLEKYPEMGLEKSYGSPADREILATLADKITAGANTKEEKADAIAKWVSANIEYKSFLYGTYTFPIDVFYERTGNCLGYSLLISQLMREEGIPAVMCSGERGDMKNVLTLENASDIGHAWVMAYFNGKWRLYDPLFGQYNLTDKAYISKWYFTKDMEGISPYYSGMDTTIIFDGSAIFYIDGKFINYAGGMPASQYYGNAVEGGKSYNGAVTFFSKTKYIDSNGGHDGFRYIENPERKDGMINDECYTNGWIAYGGSLYYAQPNGILISNTIRTYGDKAYFFAYDGSALEIDPKAATEYQLNDGYIGIKPGEKITIMPPAVDDELAEGKVVVWESESPDIIAVNQNGEITALSKGFGTILVLSKDSYDSDFHHIAEYVQVCVTDTPHRTPDYTESIKNYSVGVKTKSFLYNGKKKTPAVTVKTTSGKILTPGEDYTVKYSKNLYPGKATITITGKGAYSGKRTITFTIKKPSLSAPKKVTVKRAKNSSTSVSTSWSKVTASGCTIKYKVQYRYGSGKWKLATKATTKNSYTIKKLSKGKKVTVKITPYTVINGKTYTGKAKLSKAI